MGIKILDFFRYFRMKIYKPSRKRKPANNSKNSLCFELIHPLIESTPINPLMCQHTPTKLMSQVKFSSHFIFFLSNYYSTCKLNWEIVMKIGCNLLTLTVYYYHSQFAISTTNTTKQQQQQKNELLVNKKKIYCIEMCCIFFFDWANCGRWTRLAKKKKLVSEWLKKFSKRSERKKFSVMFLSYVANCFLSIRS